MWDDARPQFEGDNPNDAEMPMPPSFRDLYLSPEAKNLILENSGVLILPLSAHLYGQGLPIANRHEHSSKTIFICL